MEFRPCIDIHNGKVKQIVGGSLADTADFAKENFVSEKGADFFAKLYQKAGLQGGHVILLNAEGSEYYEATRKQALAALSAYPGGLQAGGGITPENAEIFLNAGASHVIVTSYVFRDGRIDYERLRKMSEKVGRKRLVLDMSCKKTPDGYYVVTDRWQKMTQEKVTTQLLDGLAVYCDEFLIHAVDVEGKAKGIEQELVEMLGCWNGRAVTYAGGVHSMEDLCKIKEIGKNRLHVTIGSALDLFGGELAWEDVLEYCAAN